MRLILETNILISALLSPLGAPSKLLDAWERKTFTLVACDALIAELRDVTGRSFFRARLRASAAELLAAGLRDFSVFLPGPALRPDRAGPQGQLPAGTGRSQPGRVPRDRRQGTPLPETSQIHPDYHSRRDDRSPEGSRERRTTEGQVKRLPKILFR